MSTYRKNRMPADILTRLKKTLRRYVKRIEKQRRAGIFRIERETDIDAMSAKCPGVYWVETTMPLAKIQKAFQRMKEEKEPEKEGKVREKRARVQPPSAIGLIEQDEGERYVVYSGTDENVAKRLKQHLFDQGGEKTRKLGFKIDKGEFAKFDWYASFHEIRDYEIRYAVEAAWRAVYGWPVFCLR